MKYRQNPGHPQDPSPLHLKLRVVTTVPMTAEAARMLVHRAVETGVVPAGIELHWIDWAKEGGGHWEAREGKIDSRLRAALREFYGALTQGDTRFERVKE